MQTPWGEIAVRDAHIHFFSSGFYASLAAQGGKKPDEIGRMLEWQVPTSNEELADAWAKQLDRWGVEKAALIASIPGDEASVAEAVSLYPDRFYGYFMVNATAPDAAARVNAALAGGRLQGICLFPAMHRYGIGEARVRPILEAAAGRPGTIVFVHCGVLTVGVRRRLGLPSLFDMRYSNPIDLHAVALEFPSVPFVIPHFGAGYFREALMVCDLCPNVYLDTSSSNSWTRYQPAAMSLEDVWRRALEVAGAERLLFGSDSSFMPRGWHHEIFEAQTGALAAIPVSPQDARLILGDNLGRLLKR